MGHSSSIDFSRIKNKNSRVEFRMTGGPGYTRKEEELIKTMYIYRSAMINAINSNPETTKRKLFKLIKSNFIPYYKKNNKYYCGSNDDLY